MTFKEYLGGKDKSFWNPFNLPRWTYLLIPIVAEKEGLFWIIVGEILLVIVLYIFYFPQRNKVVEKERQQVFKDLKTTPKDKELFHNKKDILRFLIFSIVITAICFLLFYLLKI